MTSSERIRIENATNDAERNNNGWIKTAKGQKGRMRMESKFAFAFEAVAAVS